MPLISVITPTYAVGGISRRGKLQRAYQSLCAQALTDWEWFVVGDGCADDTGQLVRGWAATDSRVGWLNLPEHTGHPAWPRNAALAKATGRYLTFLDDDTVMGPDKLRAMFDSLEDGGGCELAWGNRAIYNSEEDYVANRVAALCRDCHRGLDTGDVLVRNLGHRFTDFESGCEDQAFFLQFNQPWRHVDTVVNNYIWHGSNRTGAQLRAGSSQASTSPVAGTAPGTADFAALVRDIPGYSASGVLEMLNHYVRALPRNLRYGEVGSFMGLTLVGALYRNSARAVAIDNFSEFGGTENALRATLDRYRVADRVEVCPTNFRTVFNEQLLPRQSLGVYFYDGQHDEEAQYLGLTLAEPFLAPKAVVFIDDTNWPAPRRAAERWIRERKLTVLHDIVTQDFRTSPHWNGLIICQWKDGHELD
jgi:hypothetical protein